MFGNKIKLGKVLHGRLAMVAKAKGYSSTEEFVLHVLEKAAADAVEELSEDEVKKQLKGLGYLG